MIAVDTNLLLYAHRPWHEATTECLAELARGPWAIPWPCIHEFLAIATHPRVFDSELWTADRDFSRFAQLTARNPLAGKSGR